MRKLVYLLLTTLFVALVGCVTINVYFPEAAAQQAADKFIGTVIDGAAPAAKNPPDSEQQPTPPASEPPAKHEPSAMLLDLLIPAAYAADTPDIRIQTPATAAIHARMRDRFKSVLQNLLDSGAVGFANGGLVAMHDASKIPLSARAQASAAIADENKDRNALYHEVAVANKHPEWESQIRATFAKSWVEHAHAGWYYQDASGAWKRK
jgi:uncharacterized protein YdbL (DUF1318 family)